MKCKLNNIKTIAIISDTHDETETLYHGIDLLKKHSPDVIIHAGDIISPKTLNPLMEITNYMICVFGNCDKNKTSLKNALKDKGIIFPQPFEFEINEKKFFIAHNLGLTKKHLKKSNPDIIIHGHTHEPEIIKQPILRINPGEFCGWYSLQCSFVILDMQTLKTELIYFY